MSRFFSVRSFRSDRDRLQGVSTAPPRLTWPKGPSRPRPPRGRAAASGAASGARSPLRPARPASRNQRPPPRAPDRTRGFFVRPLHAPPSRPSIAGPEPGQTARPVQESRPTPDHGPHRPIAGAGPGPRTDRGRCEARPVPGRDPGRPCWAGAVFARSGPTDLAGAALPDRSRRRTRAGSGASLRPALLHPERMSPAASGRRRAQRADAGDRRRRQPATTDGISVDRARRGDRSAPERHPIRENPMALWWSCRRTLFRSELIVPIGPRSRPAKRKRAASRRTRPLSSSAVTAVWKRWPAIRPGPSGPDCGRCRDSCGWHPRPRANDAPWPSSGRPRPIPSRRRRLPCRPSRYRYGR